MFDAMIDRRALLEKCKDPEFMVRNEYTEGYKSALKTVRHFIATAPALDVPRATWIVFSERRVFCDECSYKLPVIFTDYASGNLKLPKHCPECGSKMDVKEVPHELT